MRTVTLIDEATNGGRLHSFTLDFLEERVSARELLRRRVYEEVVEYNARAPEVYRGLVQPEGAERVLNGYRLRERRALDWEAQFARAVLAFERLGFVMLVNDRQIESLDEEVNLRPDRPVEVTFLKLVPLVGG